MLLPLVTYWHDHVQAPNPQTPSLLGFTATQAPILLTLRSHSNVSNHLQLLIFVVATRFYHYLIIDLALVDTCVVRRYKTSQISQKVTDKSSKSLQNETRVSLLYVDGVLSQVTKNKTYTPKNICSSASKDCFHEEYLA